ncbi:sigma-70 family RNA polymerase sigma factor [Ruficoccus amylovorans]|uniref:Sigma-70 family RNA polymerase sigma factor n=1 Tax=Ruficoccus amylovorans TaxID=1804625 RepID=A0A842HHC9_9BACT|nr:sigma-70 family RNA polymerase sigma factor [Ruficoccus amylovorans]MBC2595026.1 sigma-70 family RNA polymerase sigma factor [Ruficoccus amylovorans]
MSSKTYQNTAGSGQLAHSVTQAYQSKTCLPGDSPDARRYAVDFLPIVREEITRARVYLPDFIDSEELNGVAVCALMKAFKRFKADDTVESFGGYVRLRVRGAIVDELRRLDVMSRSVRKKKRQYDAAVLQVEQHHGRPATEEEIRAELSLDRESFNVLLDQLRPVSFLSFDQPLSDHSNGGTIGETIDDPNETSAAERLEKDDFIKLLRQRLDQMPDLERKILHMYYFKDFRLSEIGEAFGLSESRICQIHTKAIRSLRVYMNDLTKADLKAS